MKIVTALVAGLVGIAGFAAPAAAQERTVVRTTTVTPARMENRHVEVRERTVVRRDNRWRHHSRRVCTVRYRHGERIRTCRIRRY